MKIVDYIVERLEKKKELCTDNNIVRELDNLDYADLKELRYHLDAYIAGKA